MGILLRWLGTAAVRVADALRVRRFDAAAGGRRWQNAPTFGAINAEIGAAAGPVRRRGAYYARNNPWLVNGVNAMVTGLVGAGIKPQSTHSDPAVRAELHRRFRRWIDRADADGVTDFYGLQALATRTMIEGGDAFAHMRVGDDGLRIRVLDAEMVPADDTRTLGEGAQIIQGVELAATGERLAYHVRRGHPGDSLTFDHGTVRVPAVELAHLYLPVAPGQVRGISWLAPVLLRLHELDQAEDAQLLRQKIAAMFAGFVIDPTGSAKGFAGDVTNGVMQSGLEPGTLKVLPPGWDLRFSEPAQVGDSINFMQLQLRSIAAGLGVPEYLLTGDLSQANYSSLRAALVEFRARIEALQYHVIIHQFCRPIWERWVLVEYLAGRIGGDLDELLGAEWITPAQPWVDPEKDAKAAAEMVKNNFASRRQVVAGLGWDIEQLDEEIAADRKRETDKGITPPAPPPAASERPANAA